MAWRMATWVDHLGYQGDPVGSLLALIPQRDIVFEPQPEGVERPCTKKWSRTLSASVATVSATGLDASTSCDENPQHGIVQDISRTEAK